MAGRTAPDVPPMADVDWAALYDAHPEYAARRAGDSLAREQVELEVRHFKLPAFVALLGAQPASSVVEIGCATGELLAAFPVRPGGRRLGVDISMRNVAAATERFPALRFEAGDFRTLGLAGFDVVLLSDVLEHVPDDAGFLADAARLGQRVLVNLPLEDNWLNRRRAYGPADVSGHLRAYSLAQGLDLIARAGLLAGPWRRVWVHETQTEKLRRRLRQAHTGRAYGSGRLSGVAARAAFALAAAVPALGRRLFASNLFVLARRPAAPIGS